MSARDNILAKLKKADAYPMKEPQVAEYYQEIHPEWGKRNRPPQTLGRHHARGENRNLLGNAAKLAAGHARRCAEKKA